MKITILIAALLLGGCVVSSHMKQFIGEDIREIMIVDGPPRHTFDLDDGRRAFQWYWGGGAVPLPSDSWSTTTAQVSSGGFVTADTVSTSFGGGAYVSQGCLITYIAKQQQGNWIVEDIRYPDRILC